MKPEELEVKAAAELAKQQAFDVRLFACSSRGCQSSEALGVIAGLKAQGISVIFISHRLHEVVEASDRVVVLDYDGDGSKLRSLPGVVRINDSGKTAELFLARDVDRQIILEADYGVRANHLEGLRQLLQALQDSSVNSQHFTPQFRHVRAIAGAHSHHFGPSVASTAAANRMASAAARRAVRLHAGVRRSPISRHHRWVPRQWARPAARSR